MSASVITFEQLTEGIKELHRSSERQQLINKWGRTGLLKGLNETARENMAQLLENQAAQLLREAATISGGGGALTSSGQLRGFSNIAFPIVRRVFGGLVANELVSIQPMSLPSGLLFYLDYTYGDNVGGAYDDDHTTVGAGTGSTYTQGQSLYNNPSGKGIRSGSLAAGGQYDLVGTGYTRVHKAVPNISASNVNVGKFDGSSFTIAGTVAALSDFSGSNAKWALYDAQVQKDLDLAALDLCFVHIPVTSFTSLVTGADMLAVDQISLVGFGTNGGATAWGESYQAGTGVYNLRRLNKRGDWDGTTFTPDALNGDHIQFVVRLSNGGAVPTVGLNATASVTGSVVLTDDLDVEAGVGSTLTVPSFESDFATSPTPVIPEIDIKIESIAVTATTRKLRARWSPELAQDLNAYHSLDAEVELTQILSEQIALEIDREILNDLLTQGNGANLYWSRAPGKFVDKETGTPVNLASALAPGPQFTGTVREWYETLTETIIDVGNTIHRKTLRGSANFMVTGPDVCTILESTITYRANYKIDGNGQVGSPFSIGAEAVGTLSNRFTVYKDPYFPRNKILVGYKGGNYLETGYVYAPYVPLIVTPTIFAPEDFTPRKGVMTRYGKKMVRSDFYGTVTVLDLNII